MGNICMSVEFISWYSINYANNRWVYVSWQQIRPNLPGPNLPPKISGAQFARKNVSKAATTIFWGLEPFTCQILFYLLTKSLSN